MTLFQILGDKTRERVILLYKVNVSLILRFCKHVSTINFSAFKFSCKINNQHKSHDHTEVKIVENVYTQVDTYRRLVKNNKTMKYLQ